ncbi:MAG: hypothetical protein ACYC2S_13530 [Spirochaetales bacterium]
MKEKLAVLVISCDNYRDTWKPFFDLFAKFWPDCPYRLYLGTNKEDFIHPRVTVLKSGEDISWADNVQSYLRQVGENYVLTFLDDFFISRPVSTKAIENAFQLVLRDGIDLFSLTRPMKGERYKDEQDVYFIDPHADYCVNTSIAIRNKDVFNVLLKPGFTAWDFEVRNSSEVKQKGAFPGVFVASGHDCFYCKNGIWRRKWVLSTVLFCRRLGISIDTSMRPFMSISDIVWEFFKVNGRKLLPSALRRYLKRIMIKLGFSHRFVSQD